MLRTNPSELPIFRGKQFVTPFSVARLLHENHFSQRFLPFTKLFFGCVRRIFFTAPHAKGVIISSKFISAFRPKATTTSASIGFGFEKYS